MKFIDNIIATIAPRHAVKRLQAKQAIKAYYEAATMSRLHTRKVNSRDPDRVVKPALRPLRDAARYFEQNYDLGRGVLNVLVANTIGDGVKPIAMVKDKNGELAQDFNTALKGLWDDWIRYPEVTGDFDYYSAQRMVARSLFRDGEVLTQFLEGNVKGLDHKTIVPFSIELIEADYLPSDYDDFSQIRSGLIQGVEKNSWGRTTAFEVYKHNPDTVENVASTETKRIPADKMIHLKMVDRIRQTRGVSIFASIMNRIDDIKEIDENERVAARVAAAMAGFIKKGSPDMYIKPDSGIDDREMEFQPGMIFDELMIGEEIGTIDTTRPNNELIAFRDAQLQAVAAGAQASYSSVSKNYGGTYSSQRQELVEQYQIYGILWAYFKNRFAVPVWDRFVNMAIASGAVVTNDIDITSLYDAEHTRPPLTWIDPKKEMDAIQQEIDLKITSRSDVIRRRGGDPDLVLKKIAEENKAYIELGLSVEPQTPDQPDDKDQPVDPEDLSALEQIEIGDIVQSIDGDYLRKTKTGYEIVKN